MFRNWMSTWYQPQEGDTIAYLAIERIAEIGGCQDGNWTAQQVNQGNATLSKWCRINCKEPGTPVNVQGKTAWAFKHSQDAVLFKLTWG